MNDVQIQPFGRTLMSLAMGKIAYQANMNNKNLEMIKRAKSTVETQKEDFEMWYDMTMQTTMQLADKRFKQNRNINLTFDDPKYKKSVSANEINLREKMLLHTLRAKAKYHKSISNYNKMILDKKLQGKETTL